MPYTYLRFVVIALVVAATISLVAAAMLRFKQQKDRPANRLTKLEALEFNPNHSPELDPLVKDTLRLWEVERKLSKPSANLTTEGEAGLKDEALKLRRNTEQAGMSYFDPTGQHYSPSPLIEVLSGDTTGALPMLVIAQNPAIIYDNKLIKKASVDLHPK